jgi:hypothetical protein
MLFARIIVSSQIVRFIVKFQAIGGTEQRQFELSIHCVDPSDDEPYPRFINEQTGLVKNRSTIFRLFCRCSHNMCDLCSCIINSNGIIRWLVEMVVKVVFIRRQAGMEAQSFY